MLDSLKEADVNECHRQGYEDGRYGGYLGDERGLPKKGKRRAAYDRGNQSGRLNPMRY